MKGLNCNSSLRGQGPKQSGKYLRPDCFLLRFSQFAMTGMPIFTVFILILLTACNTTKFVPEGEFLLNKVEIKMEDKGVDPAVLLPYIQQSPNSSKLGLGIYSLVSNESNFIKRFIRKIGEPPVLFNNHLMVISVNELDIQMKNMGYLQSTVSAQVDTIGKKAAVTYLVRNEEPYRIRTYTLEIPQLQNRRQSSGTNRQNNSDRRFRTSQGTQRDRRLIKEGSVFDLSLLEKERTRVSSQLRNRGYYTLTEGSLHYLVDTTLRSNQVDLKMILTDTTRRILPHTVRRVNVFSGYDPLAKGDYKIVDSLEYAGLHIYYDSLHFLRPKVIREKVQVRPDRPYRESQGRSTFNMFQTLSSVSQIDVQYETLHPDSAILDCNIYLTPANNHSLQAGLDGTNKAGDFGIALDITYGNRNIFNGSELFNVRLRGAYEFVGGRNSAGVLGNYYELGITPSLTFPQWRLPFIGAYMTDRYKGQTQFGLGYNMQRQSEYIRNFFNFKWQYTWASRQNNLSHSLSVLDINYVNMPWQSDKLKNYLQDADPLIKHRYDNIFTAGIGYGLVYTNAEVGRMRQNLYTIRFSTESSGNLLRWIFDAYYKNKQGEQRESYDILGNPFAQYLKGDLDFAWTFQLNETNGLAFRAGVGIACPYKNSSILPFEKRYYGGGPNHVRGWHTRNLGPGSYKGISGDPTTQTGDINLILSAEYRLRVLSWLEPAIFVDAGNLWTIKDYADQPGGLFRWNTFYRQVAVGTGVGLRFDFNFLIFRLDAGTQIYDPALSRSVFLKDNFFKRSAIYVAIGYPF